MKLIYLIENTNGMVKIGCSADPWKRCHTIASSSPYPVTVIAQWPGSHAEERELHSRFAGLHAHREWFRVEGPLAEFVAQRRGLNITEEDTPPWARPETFGASDRREMFIQRRRRLEELKGQAA